MIRSVLLAAVSTVILGSVAMAADLPAEKGPPVYAPPPPPVFSWTGVYVGGQVGYEWGNDVSTGFTPGGVPTGTVQGFDTHGVNGGGHIGYNYQMSQFVLGVEGDVNGANNRGGWMGPSGNTGTSQDQIEPAILGRAGIAFDRALIYVQGGGAFANFRYGYFNPPGTVGEVFNDGRVGWTVGGGIEYAIDNNWSVFADYRYSDYGSFGNTFAPGTFGGNTVRQHPRENLAQVGFSYRFGEVPPPAPPLATKY